MGVGEDDAQYLRGVQEALNAMIALGGGAGGRAYVDVYRPSAGAPPATCRRCVGSSRWCR